MTNATAIEAPEARRDGSLLQRAVELAPLIESEAEASERETTVTQRVVDAVKASGLYWMMTPTALGGGGATAVESIEVYEELSRADGSTGWSVMVNSNVTAIAAGYLPKETVELMWGGSEAPIVAGNFTPTGKLVDMENGSYEVSASLPFGSATARASWIAGGTVVTDKSGNPKIGADGIPEFRAVYLPREQVNILGNWDVQGLKGTGSYDYEFPQQVVDASFTMPALATTPLRDEPIYGLGVLGIAMVGHCGVALGLMKRALQEVVRIVDGKKRLGYPTTVGEHPMFLSQFAVMEAKYRAVRAFILEVFAEAEADGGATPLQLARIRQVSTWAQQVCDEVVSFCHVFGASQSIKNSSALGRCKRDISVATNHALIDPVIFVEVAPTIAAEYALG